MNIQTKSERFCFWCLLAGIAASAFSLPLARIAFSVCLIVWVVDLIRQRKRPAFPRVAMAWTAFCGVVLATSIFGLAPRHSLAEMDKLVWFFVIPLTATLLNSRQRLIRALQAFSLGSAVLGGRLLIRASQAAAEGVASGMTDYSWAAFASGLRRLPTPNNFWWALMDHGDLTDAQSMMVGIVVSSGFLMLSVDRRRRTRLAWVALWCLQAAAILLQFKRGTWLSTVAAVVLLVIWTASWSRRRFRPVVARLAGHLTLSLVTAALVVAALAAAPPVRRQVSARYQKLREQAQTAVPGGRLTMWMVVTPELVRRYPWGIGWCATNQELLQSIYPRLEARKTLHSNLAEVLVGTGWIGLAFYCFWMLTALADALKYAWRAACRNRTADVMAAVLLCSLLGLLANGLVESNLRKGNLVLILALIMGAAAAGRRRLRPPVCDKSNGQSALPG